MPEINFYVANGNLKIKIDEFPDYKGVYIISNKEEKLQCLKDSSGILKIGSAKGKEGIKGRFKNYNNAVSSINRNQSLGKNIEKVHERRGQITNVHLMYFFMKNINKKFFIKFIKHDEPTKKEKELLYDFLSKHYQYPPLNSGNH